MNQFINDKESIVIEAIDGLLRTSGGALTRLDGYPHVKVVLRTDWDRSKVALISGGGSGHEPAHAGFVGQGMLTVAVCGEVFASPSVNAVLAAILAVTGDAGCLLIVKNYTGDRLNFGLAAERARALGVKVSMVVVNDDIALPDIPQARGIAGTLFVHKIAGALSEQGCDLAAVTAAAQRVIKGVCSIGISLNTCNVFGSQNRIAPGKAELGLGIHGEPGARQVEFRNAEAAMTMVVEQLLPYARAGKHAVLLNNLGGTTALEMSILAKALTESALKERISLLIGPASYMTSLDMHGFSLSLLPLTAEDTKALTAPVAPAAWIKAVTPFNNKTIPLPSGLTPGKPKPSTHNARRVFTEKCCAVIIAIEDTLNELDTRSGDGDTGSTLATAARALISAMDSMPFAHIPELLSAIGVELSNTTGGSSGVLLAIFFSAAGGAAADGMNIADSLKYGLQRIMDVGGAARGDRTMIDALAPALDALPSGVNEAAKAARNGANATGTMTKAMAGRAAYVPEKNLIGNNDPGAEAVALLFEGIAKSPIIT